MDKKVVDKLLKLKKKYKRKLELEMRENHMQGITFIIAKVMDELFNELGKQ